MNTVLRLGMRYLDSEIRLKCEVCGASPPRPARSIHPQTLTLMQLYVFI